MSDIITDVENTLDRSISIYPNPAYEEVKILLQEATSEATGLVLIDQFGRSIDMGLMEKGRKEKTISVKDLADGMYILSLQNTQVTHRIKVMVVHR